MLSNISKAKRRSIAKTTLESLKVGQAASSHWDYWAAEFRSVPRAVTASKQWEGCCWKCVWIGRGNAASTQALGHLISYFKLADPNSRLYLGTCE